MRAPNHIRLTLRDNGYMPLPDNGKAPVLKNWQQKFETNPAEIDLWGNTWPGASNTGVLTRFVPFLDIDVLDPDAAAAVEELIRERFEDGGYILVRIGKPPKRAVPFFTDEPFAKILIPLIAPNGDTSQKLEFLADGQQCVVDGIHPDTGDPYTWFGKSLLDVRRDELPYIREAQARELIDAAAELLVAEHGYKRTDRRAKKPNGGDDIDDGDRIDWAELTNKILAGQDLHDSTRDLAASYIGSGMSAKHALRQLRVLMLASSAPRDERFQDRLDNLGRLVRDAEVKFGKPEAPRNDEQRPLPWLNMSSWDDGEPPPIEWSITNLVPRDQVGLFSGVGGTGKTTTELLKDVAHVTGLPWLNWMPTQGPVMFVGCEDTDKVWRIRLTTIARHFQTTFAGLIAGGFHLLNLYGQDATLFHHSGKSGRIETTPLYKQIYQAAGDLKPINISLDPLARIFAGNEMDRTQAYGLNAHVQALALASGGSVTILSHPSLQGIKSGSGYSGSTAWHDAFRFRQYLRAAKDDDDDEPIDPANDNGLRELTFMKNQYGPTAAKVTLRYQRGLFLPVSNGGGTSLEKLATEAKVDTAFLDLLDRFTAQGRNVGAAPTSNNYAPTVFAKEDCGFNRKQLEAAMRRLFAAAKIKVESYGKASDPHQRLVRADRSRIPSRIGPASVPHVAHLHREAGVLPSLPIGEGERALPTTPEGERDRDQQDEDCLTEYEAAMAASSFALPDLGPDPLDEHGVIASVPFMITQDMKRRLHEHGYNDEQISRLTPQEANEILTKV